MLNVMKLVVIIAGVRSAQNVGSVFRTADAVGAVAVWTCGLTPHPHVEGDTRPPHVADRAQSLITKTALGAESTVPHRHFESLGEAIIECRTLGYSVLGLEQSDGSVNLFDYHTKEPTALIVGPEVNGLGKADLASCDAVLEIPMRGSKESLNVAVAAGIALYQLSR